MDADTIFLALRVIVALGVVLAVLWILRRRLAKGQSSGGRAKPARTTGARRTPLALFGRAPQGPTAAVRGRHALGQKSSVAVVEFDGREFLLGVTEHGVTVLHQAGSDGEELDGVDDLVEELPVAAPEPEPQAAAPVAEPVEVAPVSAAAAAPESVPAAEPAPEWAALFARELLAAQQAMGAEPSSASAPQPAPAAEPQPAAERQPTAERQPAGEHEPATVFAPRYARSGSPISDVEIDPASGLVPQPLPVRTVITGQFVAEVQLMPLPTSAIPIVSPAPPPAPPAPTAQVPSPAPAPAPTGAPAARPASAGTMLPITAMIPTITIPARPAPAPVVAPAAAHQPQQQEQPPRPPSTSALAGSILSPDTWRQTVDAFRQLR
jgi:flagellar protein FliO/FliZ